MQKVCLPGMVWCEMEDNSFVVLTIVVFSMGGHIKDTAFFIDWMGPSILHLALKMNLTIW